MKIHVMHTGKVCVSPALPFGGEDCSMIRASGIFARKTDRLWLPVSAYLIEHPQGLILVDTGLNRTMSLQGEFDKKAQIASLGSRQLYLVNQGEIPQGRAIDEQLEELGYSPHDLEYVLLTHLDCDHANGLSQVSEARRILVSAEELAATRKGFASRVRYQSQWWEDVDLKTFEWNGAKGPFQRSYDLFGDSSIELIAIPGHCEGLFAVRITNADGRFVLLYSDGGYSDRSWRDMILPGIATDRAKQRRSLEWIRAQSLDERCIESLANHDPDIIPHVIEL